MSDLRHEEATDTTGAEAAARPSTGGPSPDAGAVGERVAAILQAAEDAAEQIRTDALRRSDALRPGARDPARPKVGELTNEAPQSRREAHDSARDLRMAVEASAK